MIWIRLISWVVGRGLVSGAVVGALLGAILAFIYGALIGLLVGGIVGAILGFIDGISLAVITRFAYTPANVPSRYPKWVYTVTVVINTAPIVIVSFVGAFSPFTLQHTLTAIAVGGLIAAAMGLLTAYFAGLFLEFADWLMGQTTSRNTPANMLS
jgi:hypothetical protein